MTRIAIVGGGVSGLAAAFELEQARLGGVDVEYTLYESSPRLGGVLRTERVDGCLVEAGPDSFVTEKPWAADLCCTLGIGDQLIGSNDAERKTYILTHGRLVEMPDGLMFMSRLIAPSPQSDPTQNSRPRNCLPGNPYADHGRPSTRAKTTDGMTAEARFPTSSRN